MRDGAMAREACATGAAIMNGDLAVTIARAFRRVALPLAAYYAVTVAVPLANGAAQSGVAFVRHTLVVLIVPPILVVLLCVVREWR